MNIRKIILPSGKPITVTFIGEEPKTKPRRVEKSMNLHICLECGDDKVRPVDWEEHGERHWWIQLHCSNCDLWLEVIAPHYDCDLYDVELEHGMDSLLRDYRRLMTTNMTEEIERFSRALATGLILPEDF